MPQQVVAANAANLRIKPPVLNNTGTRLVVSSSLLNDNAADMTEVLILSATLDSKTATLVTLPWYVGSIEAAKEKSLGLIFPADGLQPREQHTVQIKGIGKINSQATPFTLSFAVSIPAPILAPPIKLLAGEVHVTSDLDAGLWNYVVDNHEANNSGLFISSFQIQVDAPFVVRGTPPGWRVQTDGLKYVLWTMTDAAAGRSSGVPPGASLGGFQIQAASKTSEGKPLSLVALGAARDQRAVATVGTVLGPGHIQ